MHLWHASTTQFMSSEAMKAVRIFDYMCYMPLQLIYMLFNWFLFKVSSWSPYLCWSSTRNCLGQWCYRRPGGWRCLWLELYINFSNISALNAQPKWTSANSSISGRHGAMVAISNQTAIRVHGVTGYLHNTRALQHTNHTRAVPFPSHPYHTTTFDNTVVTIL